MLMVSSQQRAEDFLQQTEEYSLIIALPTPPFPSLLIPVPRLLESATRLSAFPLGSVYFRPKGCKEPSLCGD